jgi:hypothetical protein
MLTALSVARDCDMIPDDAKIIAVEANELDDTPTFTYAQVYNRRVKEVRYDLNVCRYSPFWMLREIFQKRIVIKLYSSFISLFYNFPFLSNRHIRFNLFDAKKVIFSLTDSLDTFEI